MFRKEKSMRHPLPAKQKRMGKRSLMDTEGDHWRKLFMMICVVYTNIYIYVLPVFL